MKPAMILLFLQGVFTWGLVFFGFYLAFVVSAINMYFFSVLYSLYEKFEDETQQTSEITSSGIAPPTVTIDLINDNVAVPHVQNLCDLPHATAPPSYFALPMSKPLF